GGNVELRGIEGGVAKLALQGSCNGCAASRATLELAIKQSLEEHAPDLGGIEVEGLTEPDHTTVANGNGLELPVLHSSPSELPVVQPQPSRWLPLDDRHEAQPGELRSVEIEDTALVIANVDGSLLAYRNECAACGEALEDAELRAGILRCSSCRTEF